MKNFNAFIFDLDGVLVDTAKYHFNAWKKLANSLNFDFTEEQNEQLKGISRIDSLKLVLKWGGLVFQEDVMYSLANKKNSWYVEMISKMTPNEILPGALQLIEEAKKRSIKIALGSASKNSSLILSRTGLENFFDVVVDGNVVTKSKPNPEVFLKAAQLLNENPKDCLVFEDAYAGVEAANKANMQVVGIGDRNVLHNATLVTKSLENFTMKDISEKLNQNKLIV